MVLILSTIVFFVIRVLPGDPILSAVGPRVSEEEREEIREALGLNRPLVTQYVDYLEQIATLDFGDSIVGGRRPIRDELAEKFPATVELAVPAMLLAAVFGVVSGAFAAGHRKQPADYSLRLASVVIYSIPIFWLGLMMQVIFSGWLGWFPLSHRIGPEVDLTRHTNFYIIDAIITGNWNALGDVLLHLFLPTVTLGTALTGVYIRLTRVNMIEILNADFITAGRARGLPERRLIYRHALHNTFIPILTLIGLQFAILLAGAVLTETVFSWPGIGRYLIEGINNRNYPVVQATVTIFAMLVAAISLIMDIMYAFIDPRIRY
ncbi:MAG: ABC transporter permease [Anaerolineae bacterium]|nr:ABC transporter permease [Anaerolineae bacterium]